MHPPVTESSEPRSRVRLLEFLTVLGIGGTERQFVNLARGLDRSRFELHVGCLTRAGEFLNEIEALRVPLTEYKVTRLYNLRAFTEQLRLARYIKRHRIQIVHTYNFYANVFAIPAARLAGVPVIVASIRDNGDPWTPMQRRLQRLVCRLSDCVLTNAEANRRSLIAAGYDAKRIEVIRNGIDVDRPARQDGASSVRTELGLPPGAPLVVLVARLNRLKGVEYFLDAAAVVARRVPEARFLIVGDTAIVANGTMTVDSAYRRMLEGYAARLGLGDRVVFVGLRVDVSRLLSEASVSVLPSLSEGMSNVLLESMAAGVPVVATTVGGNPEVVEQGTTGFLVPARDGAALARAICLLLKDRALAARFGEAGRRRVARDFSLERMVRESEHLYEGLLERATRAAVETPSYGTLRFESAIRGSALEAPVTQRPMQPLSGSDDERRSQ